MPSPRPRQVLAAIPPYRPGKPALTDDLKLSSNELPFAPLPGVLARAASGLERANRYPDGGNVALAEAIAGRLGVTPTQVVAGTGSTGVLYALLRAFAGEGDEVVFPWRSFEAYPIAVALTGATAVPVPLAADGSHDLTAMLAAVTPQTRVVLVCTPNNPTGPALSRRQLGAFLDSLAEDVLVVVDEAYREFVTDPLAVDGVTLLDRPNVLVLRTFSKAHGLAGLRVGYAVGPEDVVAPIRVASLPFGVTSFGAAAAIASLEAADALAERVAAVVGERDRVLSALRDQGWAVPDAQGNFVWLDLGADSESFADACAPLSVRAFAGEGVRISIGDSSANTAFLEAAHRWRD